MRQPTRRERLRAASALLAAAREWPHLWPSLMPIVERQLSFLPGLAHEARWAKTPEEVRLVELLVEQATDPRTALGVP